MMPTTKQIQTLFIEAANHGDDMQVAICDRALGLAIGGDPLLRRQAQERARVLAMTRAQAIDTCAAAIDAAHAMGDRS